MVKTTAEIVRSRGGMVCLVNDRQPAKQWDRVFDICVKRDRDEWVSEVEGWRQSNV